MEDGQEVEEGGREGGGIGAVKSVSLPKTTFSFSTGCSDDLIRLLWGAGPTGA